MAQVNMDDFSTRQEKQVAIVTMDDDSDNVYSPEEWAELDEVAKVGFTKHDQRDMQRMGKKQQFRVRWANSIIVTFINLTADREISSSSQPSDSRVV